MPYATQTAAVRRATMSDFAGVVRLRDQLARQSRARRPDIYRPMMLGQTEALFNAQLGVPGETIYVAEIAGAVIGYAWVATGEGTGNDGMFPRRFAYVYQLIVDASTHNRGAGRALLASIEADALADGVEVLQLNVDATNVDAKAFYDRVGWGSVSEMRQKLLRDVRRIEHD